MPSADTVAMLSLEEANTKKRVAAQQRSVGRQVAPAKAAKKLSSAEKTAMTSKKTGPARQSWPVSPSGKRKPAK